MRLEGELDLASCRIAARAFTEARVASGDTVVDLSRVTFIDVQGLRFLLAAQREARAAGQLLILRHPHRVVRRLGELSGLPLLEVESVSDQQAAPAPSRDVVAICTSTIDRAMGIDRTDKANMQLFDPSRRGLRIVVQHGFKRDFLDFFEVVDGDDDSACASALTRGRSVWVPDTAGSPIFAGMPALDVMLDSGSRAVASVPVLSPHGRLIGMISTHHNRRCAWSDQRRRELEGLAHSAGRLLHELIPNGRRIAL